MKVGDHLFSDKLTKAQRKVLREAAKRLFLKRKAIKK